MRRFSHSPADRSTDRTGPYHFIHLLLDKSFALIGLNVLFLAFSLPVVTLFPALVAMQGLIVQLLRGQEAAVTREFPRAFRKVFRRTWAIGLAVLAVFLLLWFSGSYYLAKSQQHRLLFFPYALVVAAELYLCAALLYLLPLLSSVDLPLRYCIHNALLLPCMSPLSTLLSTAVCILILRISFLRLPQTVPLLFLISCSLCAFINAYAAWPVIERFVLPHDGKN